MRWNPTTILPKRNLRVLLWVNDSPVIGRRSNSPHPWAWVLDDETCVQPSEVAFWAEIPVPRART